MLDCLAEDHEVTLLAPAPGKDQPSPPEGMPYHVSFYQGGGAGSLLTGTTRAVLGGLPLQSGLFYQRDLRRRLRELAPRHDLGILQLVRLAIHAEDFGATPFVVDLIDSLSLNFSMRARVDRWWLAPFLRMEARLLAAAEQRLAERAERVLVVCERDRQAVIGRLPADRASRVSVVPLSVEADSPRGDGGGKPVLVMTGNLGYFPNVDAVTWWLQDVWPDLKRVQPDVRLVVAGARPTRAVRQAVRKADVQLLEAPEDLRAVLSQATLALAPLRCGSGVPIKVLEAWAVGVPVLVSPWAAAGTSGQPGEDFLLVGRDPAEWVAAVTGLLGDPMFRSRLIENGRRRLAADYSREAVRDRLLEIIRGLGLRKRYASC